MVGATRFEAELGWRKLAEILQELAVGGGLSGPRSTARVVYSPSAVLLNGFLGGEGAEGAEEMGEFAGGGIIRAWTAGIGVGSFAADAAVLMFQPQ